MWTLFEAIQVYLRNLACRFAFITLWYLFWVQKAKWLCCLWPLEECDTYASPLIRILNHYDWPFLWIALKDGMTFFIHIHHWYSWRTHHEYTFPSIIVFMLSLFLFGLTYFILSLREFSFKNRKSSYFSAELMLV